MKVIFAGYAKPWANMLSLESGAFWLNPAIKPLPFDLAKANQILDSLGYKRGSDGIRMVPATTGKYAQAAHPMDYNVIVPDSLDFNGDRQFQIIADDWAKIGIKLHEVAGGDSGQAYGDRDRRGSTPSSTSPRGTGPSTSTLMPSCPT